MAWQIDALAPDPFVDRHLRELLGPGQSPNTRTWKLAEERVLLDRIGELDGLLDDLTMERRWMLGRVERVHRSLWQVTARLVRRRPPLDVDPLPPAVPGAEELFGSALRDTALMVLDRHGPMRLRDLDGYLRRYGYVVGGNRPVQRLGDAMAFEVRSGRARRLGRGKYALAVGESVVGAGHRLLEPWSTTPGDGPAGVPVDPLLRSLPERWQPSAWATTVPGDLIDDMDDLDDLADEIDAVLRDYAAGRHRAYRELYGHRNPRSFVLPSLAGDSLTIRRQGAPRQGNKGRGDEAGGGSERRE